MFRNIFTLLVAVFLVLAVTACKPDAPEYNTNSGYDGTRDSASQLLLDNVKSDTIDATNGDNEDWYYFLAKEDGFITVNLFLDAPAEIEGSFTVHDGFGRPIQNDPLAKSPQSLHVLPRFEVKANERYFIAIKAINGKSTYSIEVKFELPPTPEPDPVIVDDTPDPTPTKQACIPADKCKPGQNCCKSKKTNDNDDAVPANAKIVQGSIVVSTPREGGIIDIRINGLGSKHGVKVGMKAYLHGLNRKVDLYSCKSSSCNGTVKATSEEIARYGTVDVVIE